MKTCHFNLKACTLLAALMTMSFVSSAIAEDAGVVRLGDAPATASVSDEGEVIIRGQSDLRRRNARTSKALLQLLSAHDEPACASACDEMPCDSYNTCDGCASYPVTPSFHGSACAAPACAVPAYSASACDTACAAPSCDTCGPTYGSYASCAPIDTSCDGCAPFVGADCCDSGCADGCDSCYGDGCDGCCSYCDGNGCDYCGVGTARVGGGLFNRMTDCPHGYSGSGCSICDTRAVVNRNAFASFLGNQAAMSRARRRHANAGLNAYLRCKLGYFIPSGGACGTGAPLFGHYTRVYSDDPGYFDGRDGQIYAAPGVGGPVSVPLAPNVRHAYNYGWGVPSSRLTPVSNSGY
ncbi:MAG: hypothetical protein KDA93_17680 [Planctomycetaceae bacterium]|nr:hypothetical protein [Planctomycetaceae bacterium]